MRGLVVAVVLLAAAGCDDGKRKRTADEAAPATDQPVDATTRASLDDIAAADKANEVSADRKYKGQRFAMDVTPMAIQRHANGEPQVIVSTGHRQAPGRPDVVFVFPQSRDADAAKWEVGKVVTIEGTCGGIVFAENYKVLGFQDCLVVPPR